jgi:signal transduction histidine kinase/CheY-like chemotaxis protein
VRYPTDSLSPSDRGQEERFDELQKTTRPGFWNWEISSGKITWSDEVYRIFGLEKHTFTPSIDSILELSPWPEYRQRDRELMERAKTDHGRDSFEQRFLRPDGSTGYCISTYQGLYDESEELVAIEGMIQDISVFRSRESEIREEEQTKAGETRFQRVLEVIPDMLSIQNRDMEIIYSNWNGFGNVPPEKRLLHSKCYKTYRGVDSECPTCQAKKVLKTRQAIHEERHLVDGRWIYLSVLPILNADGECEMFVESVRDITEQREIQEKLGQMEKMDAIGKLAGGIAHDFNNQLSGILGFSELLKMELDDPKLQAYAGNIELAAMRSADLTRKLLSFARKGQYEHTPVDLHGVIHEVTDILSHSVDKRIEIRQELKARPATTKGDPSEIQSSILNLTINACDAMSEGGVLTISTAVKELGLSYCQSVAYDIEPGYFLSVCVSDTGSGIPRELQEKIFEPFFTTKEVGKGTGMGLAAVYGAMKQHNGAIEVKSEPGRGTTFRLLFPLESQPAESVAQNPAPDKARQKGSILFVDDEELLRRLCKEMLESLGYTVETADNGESGVAYYTKHWRETDLVILDMIMPKMNGSACFKAMSSINPSVKVLLASGYSADGTAREMLSKGVKGFVQKPFLQKEIAAAVEKALRE